MQCNILTCNAMNPIVTHTYIRLTRNLFTTINTNMFGLISVTFKVNVCVRTLLFIPTSCLQMHRSRCPDAHSYTDHRQTLCWLYEEHKCFNNKPSGELSKIREYHFFAFWKFDWYFTFFYGEKVTFKCVFKCVFNACSDCRFVLRRLFSFDTTVATP